MEQQVTASGTTTTTLYLSNLEEVAITGSTTTNTAYFYANGQRIALCVNGSISYLGDDGLGSATTLDSSGNGQASELWVLMDIAEPPLVVRYCEHCVAPPAQCDTSRLVASS